MNRMCNSKVRCRPNHLCLAHRVVATSVLSIGGCLLGQPVRADEPGEPVQAQDVTPLPVPGDEDSLPPYAVLVIPAPPNIDTEAGAVLNTGEIVAASYFPQRTRILIGDGVNVRERLLPDHVLFGGIISASDSGWIVIASPFFIPSTYGYFRPDGSFSEVILPPGTDHGAVLDVNEHGVMCANLTDSADGDGRAYRYQHGAFTALPHAYAHDRSRTSTIALNDSGIIVGKSGIFGDVEPVVAVKWVGDEIALLTTSIATDPRPYGINNAGLIIGSGRDLRYETARPLLWAGDEPARILESPNLIWGSWNISALMINNRNRIIGSESKFGVYLEHRFIIWPSPDVMARPVADLFPPNIAWADDPDGSNAYLFDINDHDQIVGTAMHKIDDEFRSFIMTPVTWSFRLSDLVPGQPGVENTLSITGAPANAEVTIFGGRHGGGALIPGCRILDNVLQIEDPRPIATVTTDANGEATISDVLPPTLASRRILLQAYIQSTCEISNLVVQEIE